MKWPFHKDSKETESPKDKVLEALRQSRRFRGVQLHRCGCRASIRLLGRFFSFRNAPRLPLAQCDAEICSCTYLGIVDRRRTERRAEPVPVKLSRMEQERRASIDRRRPSDVWHGRDR